MSRATRRALTVLLTTSGGCAEWPRFANLPTSDAVDVDLPAELTLGEPLLEPAAPGWPDTPDALPADTQSTLGALWEVTRIEGTLSPFGQNGLAKVPFDCAPEPSTVAYTSDSDIDWLHLWSDGRPLCLLLEADAASTPEWDTIVHAFDPAAGCVTGPFLNPAGGEQPVVTMPNVATFLDAVPEGPLAIYVAGVTGQDAAGTEVPYTLHVVPATVAESCEALQVSDLTDLAERP